MIEQAFGQVLKELRNERKMSQERLAIASELDRTFISLMERGKRQPSLVTIFKISSALQISPAEFIAKVEKQLTKNSSKLS